MTETARSHGSWRYAFRTVLLAAACAVIAYAVTWLLHKRYEAEEVIIFPGASQSSGGIAELLGKTPQASDQGDVPLLDRALESPLFGTSSDAALGIVKSQGCLRFVVEKNGLQSVYGQRTMSKAIKTLDDRLNSSVDKQGLLHITVDDEDPERSEAIAGSVEDYLRTTISRLSLDKSKRNTLYVAKELAKNQRTLEAMERTVQKAVASAPFAVDMTDRTKTVWTIKEQAIETRVKAVGDGRAIASLRAKLKSLYAKSDTFANKVRAIGALNQDLSDLTNDLVTQRSNLEAASKTFTKTSPEYKKAAILFNAADTTAKAVLRAQAKALPRGEDPRLIDAEASYAATLQEATDYENAARKLIDDFTKDSIKFVHDQVLKGQFTTVLTMNQKLQQDLVQARIAESRDPDRFEVLDPPIASDEPVYPKRALTVGVVFALALLVQLAPLLLGASRTTAEAG